MAQGESSYGFKHEQLKFVVLTPFPISTMITDKTCIVLQFPSIASFSQCSVVKLGEMITKNWFAEKKSFLSYAAINDAFSSVQQLPGHTYIQGQFKKLMQPPPSHPLLLVRLLCLSFNIFFFVSCLYIPLEAHVLQSENHSNIVYITPQNIVKRQENCQAR